jgi:hypothetical protein
MIEIFNISGIIIAKHNKKQNPGLWENAVFM